MICFLFGGHPKYGIVESRLPERAPLIMDLMWPVRSPVLVIAQFFSTGLAGESPLWSKIVFKVADATSFAGLARAFPELAMAYRKGIYAAATSLKIRQGHRLDQSPWFLAIVADFRRTLPDREEASQRVHRGCNRCVESFGLAIRQNFPSPELVRSERCIELIDDWIAAHDLHNAGAEVRHARNKKAVTRLARPELMVAKGLISDAKFAMTTEICAIRGIPIDLEVDPEHPANDELPKRQKAKTLRTMPLKMRWFNYWRKANAGMGGAASGEKHARATQAWDDLSDEARAEFEGMVKADNDHKRAQVLALNDAEGGDDEPERAGVVAPIAPCQRFKVNSSLLHDTDDSGNARDHKYPIDDVVYTNALGPGAVLRETKMITFLFPSCVCQSFTVNSQQATWNITLRDSKASWRSWRGTMGQCPDGSLGTCRVLEFADPLPTDESIS